jgi:hypothetical protein
VIRKSSREEQRQIALTVVQRTENGHTRPRTEDCKGCVSEAWLAPPQRRACDFSIGDLQPRLLGKELLCWLHSHRATSTDSQRVPWLYQSSVSSARDNGTTQQPNDVPAVVTGDLAKFLRAWPSSLSGGLPVTLIHRISYVIYQLPLRNPKSEFDSRRAHHSDFTFESRRLSIAKRAGRPNH